MATMQVSGVKRNCQHANMRFDVVAVETGTHETGRLELKEFYCPDCDQHFVVATEKGWFDMSYVPLVEKSAAAAQARAKYGVKEPAPKEAKEPAEKKPEVGDGPGKELMLVFAGLGVPSCQACKELALRMNNEGIEWCEANGDAIVADILPRAQEWLARPEGGWTDRLKSAAPQFAKEAVLRRYVAMALRNWRDKLELQNAGEA